MLRVRIYAGPDFAGFCLLVSPASVTLPTSRIPLWRARHSGSLKSAINKKAPKKGSPAALRVTVDAPVTTRVKASLREDNLLNDSEIDVKTTDHVVTLTGRAQSWAEQQAIVGAVSSTPSARVASTAGLPAASDTFAFTV